MSKPNRRRGRRFPLAALVPPLLCVLAACQSIPRNAAGDASPILIENAAAVLPQSPELEARPRIVLEPLPELAPDLLGRLRAEFSLPGANHDDVQRELEWYVRNQEYLTRVFGRGERYLFYIRAELERRHMPADLALLPIVESAFDPFAYSRGRASGLWQIIPGTGRRLGLKQNWWFDARRDVLESTRAALDYLQALHEQFEGDWLLAIAGYNSGEGNVARALARAANTGRPADFWGIRDYLPAETRTYVPRLLAIRAIVADPAAHGVTLPTLPITPYFAVVDTGGQIDLALAAELGGLDLDRLYELNPGLNRWATDPDGPHRLLVPVGQAEQMSAALATLGDNERVAWSRHKIRNGETLGQIAETYHTTPGVLREVNGLRDNLIRAGDYLLIPHATAAPATYAGSVEERVARQVAATRSGERRTHIVQAGESLWSIAQLYDVGIRELAAWNAMAPGDVLAIGRELVVWQRAQTSAAASSTPAHAGPERIRQIDYVVRRGDSLSAIATRFRVTVAKIVEWNSLSAQAYLQPGQRLVMFVDVTRQST